MQRPQELIDQTDIWVEQPQKMVDVATAGTMDGGNNDPEQAAPLIFGFSNRAIKNEDTMVMEQQE